MGCKIEKEGTISTVLVGTYEHFEVLLVVVIELYSVDNLKVDVIIKTV